MIVIAYTWSTVWHFSTCDKWLDLGNWHVYHLRHFFVLRTFWVLSAFQLLWNINCCQLWLVYCAVEYSVTSIFQKHLNTNHPFLIPPSSHTLPRLWLLEFYPLKMFWIKFWIPRNLFFIFLDFLYNFFNL